MNDLLNQTKMVRVQIDKPFVPAELDNQKKLINEELKTVEYVGDKSNDKGEEVINFAKSEESFTVDNCCFIS